MTATRTRTRAVVPAPRRSPEQTRDVNHEGSRRPDEGDDFPLYPLVGYALEHATALRPPRD